MRLRSPFFLFGFLVVFSLAERCRQPLATFRERLHLTARGGLFYCTSFWNLRNEDTPTYEKYNGSYAQDVMGYSDDEIDTIFDGDPSAYWNID